MQPVNAFTGDGINSTPLILLSCLHCLEFLTNTKSDTFLFCLTLILIYIPYARSNGMTLQNKDFIASNVFKENKLCYKSSDCYVNLLNRMTNTGHGEYVRIRQWWIPLATFKGLNHTVFEIKKKLHGLNPRANYTDRATAAWRRSDCQLFADRGCHVVSVTDPYGRILGFLDRRRYFSIK
jgi:hypothetical protein